MTPKSPSWRSRRCCCFDRRHRCPVDKKFWTGTLSRFEDCRVEIFLKSLGPFCSERRSEKAKKWKSDIRLCRLSRSLVFDGSSGSTGSSGSSGSTGSSGSCWQLWQLWQLWQYRQLSAVVCWRTFWDETHNNFLNYSSVHGVCLSLTDESSKASVKLLSQQRMQLRQMVQSNLNQTLGSLYIED